MAGYLALSARITKELQELERIVSRCQDIWQQSEASGDNRYIDGVALNLHSFYTGLERIIELVVSEIDEALPTGAAWHQELLRKAATEVPQLRPALISDATRDRLDRYRGFRHVVRNVYAFELDPARLGLWCATCPPFLRRFALTCEVLRIGLFKRTRMMLN